MPENAVDKKLAVKYSPEIALAICEAIASGDTLSDLVKKDIMPSRNTIYRWLTVYPKFFAAFERAREIAAQSFEDEAIDMARILKGANDFTGTKVQAYNIAMQQLRWSAARRDPKRYGASVGGSAGVSIQINTTLNLGQDGKPALDASTEGFTIEYNLPQPEEVTQDTDDDFNKITAMGEVVETDTETDDNSSLAFGLPEEEKQDLHNPPVGRPKKVRRMRGHKPLSATKRAITIAAKKGTDNGR